MEFSLSFTKVKAVLFAAELNMAALALHGPMAKRFFHQWDPLHKAPLVCLLDLAFTKITKS
jgi:hypothetical protein